VKIKELSIDRYGDWANVSLGQLDDRLNVILCGADSPRTAAVRFLKAMLYEIPRGHESAAESQVTFGGGSIVVEGPHGRCTIRRTNSPLSGRLSLHSADGSSLDRQLLSDWLWGVDASTIRLLFGPDLQNAPPTEALVQAAMAHRFDFIGAGGESAPRWKSDEADLGGEIQWLKERRRAAEAELAEIERERLTSLQRRDEQSRRLREEIDRCQADVLRRRGEVQSLDDEIATWGVSRSRRPDAPSNEIEARGDSFSQRLHAVRRQMQRWRRVQRDVLRRRARLRREMLSWAHNAGAPTRLGSGAHSHLASIEQRLANLQTEIQLLAQTPGIEVGKRDTSLRCSTQIAATREEVYQLCRELNRQYLDERRESIAAELRQLRRCYVEVASQLQRLATRRTRLERALETQNAALAPVRRRRQEAAAQLRESESRLAQLHAERQALEELTSGKQGPPWDVRRRNLEAIVREIDVRLDRLIAAGAKGSPRWPEHDVEPKTAVIIAESSEYLRRLTSGQFVRIHLRHDQTLQIEDAEGEFFALDDCGRSLRGKHEAQGISLSARRSVRDRVHLAVCFSLADAYARSGVQLPLILDEPFLNLDGAQAQRLAETLRDFAARGRQVLVFTCSEQAARLFRRMEVSVRELPDSRWYEHHITRREAAAPLGIRRGAAVLESIAVAAKPAERVIDVVTPVPSCRAGREAPDLTPRQRSFLRREDAVEYAPDVDPAAARELSSQGIATVGEFLALSPAVLEQRLARLHTPAETIRGWQTVARLMCDTTNLRAYDARILAASGVTSADALERLAPEELLERVAHFLETDQGRALFRQGDDDELARLASWIGTGRTTQSLRETQRRHGFKQSA
jgi:hypothetical protein